MQNHSPFHPFKKWLRALLAALALTQSGDFAQAALYQVGDVVTNLTFIARQSFTRPDGTAVPAGAQVHVRDFTGRVVFLEWFAVWCPYCTAAYPQTKAGIEDWYSSRGGNPYGVPVLYVFMNQESSASYQSQTTSYINANVYSNTAVCNDYGVPASNPARFAFQTSGQPVFVAINCVTNSPTHQPWQLLVNHLGYGDTDFSTELVAFRAAIDAVQPAIVPPRMTNAHRVGADFEFNYNAQPGRNYRVLASSNLTAWTTLRTNVGSTNTVVFRETNAPPGKRFYRVVTP